MNEFGLRLYVKATLPSFSGKQEDWSLFKMLLQAYLSTLRLESILEETFDMELPDVQATILDAMNLIQVSQIDVREGIDKVERGPEAGSWSISENKNGRIRRSLYSVPRMLGLE